MFHRCNVGFWIRFLGAGFLSLGVVLAGPLYAATTTIKIAGSTTLLPILSEAAKQYRVSHPDLNLTVSGGGSGMGVANIERGTIDIGMASRPLSEREAERLGDSIDVIPVARDAVAIAVSKAVYESGVTQLSLAQIAAIYRGEIRNWRELGGLDAKILVIDKEASRGTRHVFALVVLGSPGARAPGATIITGSNNEEQSVISRSDQAIGMISNAWLNDRVRAIAVGEGDMAVLPTAENVALGRYVIKRDLNILVPKGSGDEVKEFVAFLRSEQGQAIVQTVGFHSVR
ncbi:Phosphate ABC transporter, periplasmic phosphate-binding protein PstS (TC 3.A.1.7.1) [hydrothermal vent metagenome]|uniref:Phosphate ABC transporter, periplasmic phosphate-binding protein PstS (TC 3.A.1.7.1) n=1 Tax=hydrothermal vent metagenome TaxID=652676 RepID=A0A3B0Z6W4_9ZZZZ